jgi:hypothetical protein
MNFNLFLNFSKVKNISREAIYNKKIEKTIKTSKQRIKESKNPKRSSLKKWKKN